MSLRRWFGMCALLLAGTATGPAFAAEPCPDGSPFPLTLPAMRASLARGEPLVIVAVGSSSTRGAAASDVAHSYPAILQAELQRRLPTTHVAVLNRGIDGQDALEHLARLDRDVTTVHPQLVIWQVGVNAALRDIDPAAFRATVSIGVRWLRQPGRDVVLMDNQRAPRVLDAPRRREIDYKRGIDPG